MQCNWFACSENMISCFHPSELGALRPVRTRQGHSWLHFHWCQFNTIHKSMLKRLYVAPFIVFVTWFQEPGLLIRKLHERAYYSSSSQDARWAWHLAITPNTAISKTQQDNWKQLTAINPDFVRPKSIRQGRWRYVEYRQQLAWFVSFVWFFFIENKLILNNRAPRWNKYSLFSQRNSS